MSNDSERVTDTIADLFVGTDDRDWPRLQRCFADTVQFDMGQPSTMSPAQIADMCYGYAFQLRRQGDAWKIHAFKFNLKFIDGNAELEKD